MIIEYSKKEVQALASEAIKGIVINYTISEKDMIALADSINEDQYEERKFFLKDINSNKIDMVVDNIANNRIVQGGQTKNGDFVLSNYVIEEGIDKLVELLTPIH